MGNKVPEERDSEDTPSSAPSEVMTESSVTTEDISTMDSMKRSSTLSALPNDSQKIQCTGSDLDVPYKLNAKDVTVKCSDASSCGSESASNQVRVSQVSKFEWEQKLYIGNLVACNHTYIAYVVRVKVGVNDHVRILNHRASSRALIKCFKGKVVDLAFAGPKSNQLACIDENGTITLLNLSEDDGAVQFQISLQLQLKLRDYSSPDTNRLFWSLVLPDAASPGSKTESKIIAVTNGNAVEIFKLEELKEFQGNEPIATEDLEKGLIRIEDGHEKTVTKVVISPDESVLATSSLDGFVKFWQLDFTSSEKPECLHDWQPHDGNPVTELLFCDNQYDRSEDAPPMWRFLVTGTKNNSILKLWCAVTWNVLQTLSFTGGNLEGGMDLWNPGFKVAMDLSGSYLIMSDVTRQVLYITSFVQDAESGIAYFDTLSEFVLAQPLLSFSIYRIKRKTGPTLENAAGNTLDITNGVHDKSNEGIDEVKDADEALDETKQSLHIVMSIFGIHTRALQLLNVQCAQPMPNDQKVTSIQGGSSQEDVSCVKDGLSDISSIGDSSNLLSQDERPQSPSSSTLEEKLSIALQTLDLSSLLPSASDDSLSAASQVPEELPNAKAPEEELPDILATSSSSVSNKVSSLDVCIDQQSELSSMPAGPPDMVQLGGNRDEESALDVVTHEQRPSSVVVDDGPVTSTPTEMKQYVGIGSAAVVAESSSTVTKQTTGRLKHTESFEQSPIKSVHIPAQASTLPKTSNSCCSDALEAIRAENKEMRAMLSQLLETTTRQQELITSQLNEQRSEREATKGDYKTATKATTSHINKATKELMKNINSKLDSQFNELKLTSQDKEVQLAQNLTTPLMNTLRDKMATTVKESIRESVLPSISNMMKSSMDKMNAEVIVKMSAIEKKVKDDMEGFVKSKELTNSIAHACTGALHKTLSNIYRDELRNTVIPGFQKTIGAMFSQLNSGFSAGTMQYLKQLETHLENVRIENDKTTSPIAADLQKAVTLLQSNTDVKRTQELISKEMDNSFGRFHKALCRNQEETIDTIKKALHDMVDNLSSKISVGTMSPSPPSTKETQIAIDEFLQNDELSKAFELALSVTSLPIVTYVCDQVNAKELFDKSPCPLSQAVILSLIQQLSADLATETINKCNYITEALFALDLKDKMTTIHLNDIISGLFKQISVMMEDMPQSDPLHGQHMKALRNLRMTANGVVNEAKSAAQ